LLEAEIRSDFARTIASKYRDPLSKAFSGLCDQFRQGRSNYARSRVEDCERISLDRLITAIIRYFKEQHDLFHKRCSVVKGHFSRFRNWYAHGRCLRPDPPVIPDPEDLFDIHEEFMENVFDRDRRASGIRGH